MALESLDESPLDPASIGSIGPHFVMEGTPWTWMTVHVVVQLAEDCHGATAPASSPGHGAVFGRHRRAFGKDA